MHSTDTRGMVWSIADNAWITLDYWNYINGRTA